ncbi:MAG: VCBS repeat domain protein [Algoriphagus marincola HL-49]|uniref:VCBS repeat domain protein n=1 Tax=Algoriphagus marincola HL-49 TaxID=1305737 RepID=A0A0P7XR92_9BACT|nr:MAG: VCBS repeat domain protein [Algoriphagus marincola HL-49]
MKGRSIVLLFVVVYWACEPISERKQPVPSLYQLSQMDLNLDGEKLAELYCGNCHLMPDPSILDKKTWEESVLPDMRMRMGLYLEEDIGITLPKDRGVPPGIYSDIPLIQKDNWEKLRDYYLSHAPDFPLPQNEKVAPEMGISGFEEIIPAFDFVYPDLTTMIHVDSSSRIWLGHRSKKLFHLDVSEKPTLLDSLNTGIAPVSLSLRGSSFEVLSMGLMDPSNDSLGNVVRFDPKEGEWKTEIIQEKLMRPVHVSWGDLNGDGLQDRVIAQFGNHLGKLSVFFGGEGEKEELVLKALPGARKTELVDWDGDGDLDIIGMMTQAAEGIFLWENQGEGRFFERTLLEFQPAFGSSDFQLVDMNEDGKLDLILVNGDNADQSQILKNYHGVRIFKNLGNNEFEESWFYPMYGASGVEVADFDQDGDLDIVAISFFPDKRQMPKEDLIYFENKGENQFKPYLPSIQFDTNYLILSKGDVDADGDLDILVGSFDFNDLYKGPSEKWQPIIILRNNILN